jgi:hypothetical protein
MTLLFGLKHANSEVARESLTALSAMGQFHHSAVGVAAEAAANPQPGMFGALTGAVGLGAHNAPDAEGVGILARLMRVVLNRLIFEDASMDLAGGVLRTSTPPTLNLLLFLLAFV